MNPAYGYHVVVTPAGTPTNLAGSYTLTNGFSGLPLDTAAAGTTAGTLVTQATASTSSTQIWNLVPAGSGMYKIANQAGGKVLSLQTVDNNNNTKIVLADDNGADSTLWQLIPDGAGKYKVANYANGRVLAVAGMSKDNGAQIVQWLDGAATNACTAAGPRALGKLGNALSFCNTAAYVQLPGNAVASLTGDWSISTWVNPASNTSWQRIFDIGTGQAASMFLTANSGSTIRFAITTGGGNAEQRINGTTTLPLNQWSLVTVTSEGTTGKLYVNGALVGTNTNMTIKPSSFSTTSTRNYLGKSQYSSDPAFNGLLDDFNIYNRALTADEVLNFSTGVAGQGNVLHYTFDENTGANVPDTSGATPALNGTIVNGDTAGNGTNTSTIATNAQTADHFWTLTPVQTDTTPPTVSATVAGRTVTVTATDAGSGVASVEYQLDSGNWTAYTAPVTVDALAHTVSYRATDKAGNVSAVGSVQVAARGLNITTVAGARCVAGKVTPTITVTNNDTLPITVTATSGTTVKSFGAIAPGVNGFHAFTTRLASVPAGSISVTATATVDGTPVTVTQTAAYPATSCG